ncbi:hypothetical protein [Pontiella sp.]|uniref:hypothetical protein n=1 Tax=Pontiella sp. TaxID=2837462 RepID=UPI003563703C
MTVKELKQFLRNIPDDQEIYLEQFEEGGLFPLSQVFDDPAGEDLGEGRITVFASN